MEWPSRAGQEWVLLRVRLTGGHTQPRLTSAQDGPKRNREADGPYGRPDPPQPRL
ncbi:hypothetical protein PGT21_021119 [Puccinia graminis f. sp. tritici]|uniref:Uncharacterized protein n=1 Tax=Puccinia graminis f. sp. tritici TaxID=56615 RepID=A0A5B0NCR8_PUCGR|nr:hypothetical protein PGT21_021119 [Puccinia graminis f. sp. tritici]